MLSPRPHLTVALLCGGADSEEVADSLESLESQIYRNWDLLFLDVSEAVWASLPESAERSASRIDCDAEPGALIEAVSRAAGTHVTFLRAGDLLHRRALYTAAGAINTDPALKLLYADEDEVDPSGRRANPYFKPDWSPDLFHAHDFLSGLVIYCADELARAAAGGDELRTGPGYALHLRLAESLAPEEIRHVSSVLYHRRAGSTEPSDAEPAGAALDALREHFRRRADRISSILALRLFSSGFLSSTE